MTDGAANEYRVQTAGYVDVGDVAAPASRQPFVLPTRPLVHNRTSALASGRDDGLGTSALALVGRLPTLSKEPSPSNVEARLQLRTPQRARVLCTNSPELEDGFEDVGLISEKKHELTCGNACEHAEMACH